MNKKISIRISVLIQIATALILTATLAIIIGMIFSDTNDYRQSSEQRSKIIANIFKSEFTYTLFNIHKSIKTGAVSSDINFLFDYLEVMKEDTTQSVLLSGESRVDLFKKNGISDDQELPIVSCKNGCYLYNHYRGLYKDGGVADIKYAISLKHLAYSISSKLGINGFYIIEAPNIESLQVSDLDKIPFTENTYIHEFTTIPSGKLFINNQQFENNLEDTLANISENYQQSKFKVFSINLFNTNNPNMALLLPTRDFLSTNSITQTLSQNRIKTALAFLCLISIFFILIRIYNATNLLFKISKEQNPDLPKFFIKDEFAVTATNHIETKRTNRHLIATLKRQEDFMEKYTMFDVVTSLPLRSLFCQEVNNRINASNNIETISALAIIRFEYRQLNTINEDYKDILKDTVFCIRRVVKESDLIGIDEDYKFLLYFEKVQNCSEVLNIVKQIIIGINERFENWRKNKDILVNAGVCIKTPNLMCSHLYHNAELALYNAIKNYSEEPVMFSEQISCSSLDELTFADEFEEAIVRNHIHGLYNPIFSLDDDTCFALDISPFWQTKDGSVLNNKAILRKLTDVKRLYMLSNFIIEQGLSTLRRLDIKQIVCHHVSFSLSRTQLLDPRLPEFLEHMTMKYKILPSRIIFTIYNNYLDQQDLELIARIKILKQADYKIALNDTTLHSYSREHKYFNFDVMKFSPDLLQSAIKEESYTKMLRSMVEVAQSNQQTTIVYGITNVNEEHFTKLKIMPDALSGSFYSEPVDEFGIFTTMQRFASKRPLQD